MDEFLSRVWDQLLERTAGPFHLRFVIQPVVALSLGIRAGLRDAGEHHPPYLWRIFSNPSERVALLHSGWKDIGRGLAAGVVNGPLFQFVGFRRFHPGQAVIVAFLLAVVP